MASRRDQERIRALLTEAITVLCKNGLGYNFEFCIDGLLGITVDNDDIFLVKINEKIARKKPVLQLSLADHQATAGAERVSIEQGSVTSASPDRNSSLSQPPTPKSFNAHTPRNHQNANGDFLSGESSSRSPHAASPRKRPWDRQTPEAESKRSHSGSGTSSSEQASIVLVKEEFVDTSMEYGVMGELNGDGGVRGVGRAWAQDPNPTQAPLSNSNITSRVSAYKGSQDESSVGSACMPPPFSSTYGLSQPLKSVMLNNGGRLIAKGMSLPNAERQLIIKTIIKGGGNAETGKTPYGFLRAVANRFHIQSSTVHNIWTRYWKYRVETHGYCPGISDHKRQVNKKCKDHKQSRRDPQMVDVEDIKGLGLSINQERTEVVGNGSGGDMDKPTVKHEPLEEGSQGPEIIHEQCAVTNLTVNSMHVEPTLSSEGVNSMEEGITLSRNCVSSVERATCECSEAANSIDGGVAQRSERLDATFVGFESGKCVDPSTQAPPEVNKAPSTPLQVKVKDEPRPGVLG